MLRSSHTATWHAQHAQGSAQLLIRWCACRYVEGVSFREAYGQLQELQKDADCLDFSDLWYAAGKLLVEHVLKVSP